MPEHATSTQRIDFTALSDGRVVVTKMHRDPEGRRDVPHGTETKPAGFDLDAAIAWCEANGYTVLWWYDGAGNKSARAFRGEPWPVRRNWEVKRLRDQLNDAWLRQFHQEPGKWHPIERLLGMDLAFAG
jgi:hypothetical protein